MLRPFLALVIASGLLAGAAMAAQKVEMPESELPQPELGDPPKVIAALPCSESSHFRMSFAQAELARVIAVLEGIEQTPQVRRMLGKRRGERALVLDADMRCRGLFPVYETLFRKLYDVPG